MASFEHGTIRKGTEIHTTLSGVMTEDGAVDAILEFEDAILSYEKEHLSETFEFHVHLRDLERYEAPAREAWTRALRRYKRSCRKIVIYGATEPVR